MVVAMKICDFRATHLNTPSACGGDDLFAALLRIRHATEIFQSTVASKLYVKMLISQIG
jgi:hypothetical protein